MSFITILFKEKSEESLNYRKYSKNGTAAPCSSLGSSKEALSADDVDCSQCICTNSLKIIIKKKKG